MYRLIAAMLAAASCATIAQAQSAPPPVVEVGATLSLDQALSMAGASAPSLDAAEADINAAAAARTVAGLRPNPSISVEAENVAGSGPYRGTQSLETTTSFALPIELGGKRSARIGVADARSRRVAVQAAITQADLRFNVIQAYAEAAAAQQRLVTANDQARIAAEGFRAAQVRVQAGRASPIDMQRADVARINADADVERAQRLVEVSRFSLSRLIGQPVSGALDTNWFTGVRSNYGPLREIDSTGTLAMAAAEADLAVADAGVRLARSQRVPDLTVGAGARYMRETGDTAALFSLTIPLPLFNNGKAAVDQASSERLRAEAQKRVTALEVDQAIARAQAEAANASTSAVTAKGPALAAAEEAARIARIGYREGKFGQLELLDAERTLAETRLAAIDALLNYHNAQAQLERLTVRAPDLEGN
ncbi:putative heavy metal efflux system protein [Caenibius tardaugens NBRC 16725]|uniref:Putative heavy metal efflux system protein n=1 Tax=Caenibius tardaugens NBRC 16725 TaxID=1219035 RepID=U3A259_9SPHN|nr:TolC family protein [Caenibius tardaugens]AZI36103.1 TolC family protein [Caenibius tardaugens NBRC 16725]GAD48818.1 putative heavy metal efflux system protein [Caenibius tardaugens NBRC 16725]